MLPNKKIQILLNGKADKLFKNSQYPVPFEFNQDVVEVFDDMVSRSVPMYQEVNKAIVQWSYLFHQEKNLYIRHRVLYGHNPSCNCRAPTSLGKPSRYRFILTNGYPSQKEIETGF